MNEYTTKAEVKAYYAGRLYELCQHNSYHDYEVSRQIIAIDTQETKALAKLPDGWIDQPDGEGFWCYVSHVGIMYCIAVKRYGEKLLWQDIQDWTDCWCDRMKPGKWKRIILPIPPLLPETDPLLPKAGYETEMGKLREMLAERTLQHKTQLDNANRLRIELARVLESRTTFMEAQ